MIKIDHLKRAYGDFVAVNDVSFSIEKGEIVGLLGHNGAGKTTIMKMLSGYLEPSAGQIEIDGLTMADARTRLQQRLGYLPEALPLYPELSVADYLDYAAQLKGLNGAAARDEIRRALRATDITDKLLAPIATLSRGYKQRVGVAQAILGRPQLLILDEPTNGLDPTQTHQMRELIRTLSKEATVILSTHIMQEVEAICSRVLIMRAGELAVDAQLESLRQSRDLLLHTDLNDTRFFKQLTTIDSVVQLPSEVGYRYRLTLKADHPPMMLANTIAKTLMEQGHALYELQREQRDLETLFREVNTQEVRHAA
ncbi:MAG: ABC transporter domain-containing protein [Halothiobacillaceae bacterium]|nr:MAG: ABC transporter domain-containing protein [Halothiobacillaceae bacterium]